MTDNRHMLPAVPARRFARASIIALAALAVASCGEDAVAPPTPRPIPLIPAVWYMHAANGNDLPAAEVARRFIGVTDEQTLVDSARIDIRSGGTWEQRYWVRVFHNGNLDRSEFVLDEGSWAEDGSQMTFTSALRARTFTMTATVLTEATSNERMVFFVDAPVIVGTYRPIEPVP
jgi:hypothetical protein